VDVSPEEWGHRVLDQLLTILRGRRGRPRTFARIPPLALPSGDELRRIVQNIRARRDATRPERSGDAAALSRYLTEEGFGPDLRRQWLPRLKSRLARARRAAKLRRQRHRS
jgi:hypothetical protein